MARVNVPERGTARVDNEQWAKLRDAPGFWRLVEEKVLGVSVRSPGDIRLKGSCYVGRAIINGVSIELVEKVTGTLSALVSAAAPSAFKLVKAPSALADGDETARVLISIFLDAVRAYLRVTKEVVYTSEMARGSLIGGALSVKDTIKLRSRGLTHIAAFRRNFLSANTAINRVLLAALAAIEKSSFASSADLFHARSFSILLSDCAAAVRQARGEQHIQLALEISNDLTRTEQHRELGELSLAILMSAGFGAYGHQARKVNRAWFVNLENLFERAVRQSCVRSLGSEFSVGPAVRGIGVFYGLSNRYPANTDVVIRRGEKILAIADAKYKERIQDAWPTADEVQEILTHAAGYRVEKALIVYPSAVPWLRKVGLSKTGCELWAWGVRPHFLISDLKAAFESVGIASASSSVLPAAAL